MGYKTTLKTVKTRKPHRPYPLRPRLPANVQNQIKKVVMKQAETRSGLGTWDVTIVDDLLYGLNLTHGITQGDTVTSRQGQKISLQNFYIKGKLTAINNATVGNGTTIHRVMLIKTDQQLTTSSSSLTKSDIFRGTTVSVAERGFPDKYKISVLYDKTFVQKTDISNANQHIPFTINQKIMKTCTYQAAGASYFKEGNYYLLVTARKTDGTASNCGFLDIQWGVQFKDI